MFARSDDHGCCLDGVPHPTQAEDGETWSCESCGTRWVLMFVRGVSNWYRSKLVAVDG